MWVFPDVREHSVGTMLRHKHAQVYRMQTGLLIIILLNYNKHAYPGQLNSDIHLRALMVLRDRGM
jgi:hypothetical protein